MPGEDPVSARPCVRGPEECPGIAEPEEDGEARYWACRDCGHVFGYELLGAQQDSCQLGVPEAVRRTGPAYGPGWGSPDATPLADIRELMRHAGAAPVFLGETIYRRPE
jgi:hypothetical protein